MVLKAVILFLAVMGLMAIFGKKRASRSKITRKPGAKKPQVRKASKCPKCGAYNIGSGDCACGKS